MTQDTQNNQHKLFENYKRQKMDFLDSLQPDDFRNGGSFNQAEIIFEQLNKSAYQAFLNQEDSEEFIKKAAIHLFREGSLAVEKLLNLTRIYLEIKKS